MSSKDCLSFACFHSFMEQCLSASQMYSKWIIHSLRLVFRECDVCDFIIECQLVGRVKHYRSIMRALRVSSLHVQADALNDTGTKFALICWTFDDYRVRLSNHQV